MYLYLFIYSLVWDRVGAGVGGGGSLAVRGTCVQAWQSGLRGQMDSTFASGF